MEILMSAQSQGEAAILLGLASAIQQNEAAIETALGNFTATIQNGVVTIEGDAIAKLSPLLRGIVQGAVNALNPVIFSEIPTGEAAGLTWLVAALQAEAKKLQAQP